MRSRCINKTSAQLPVKGKQARVRDQVIGTIWETNVATVSSLSFKLASETMKKIICAPRNTFNDSLGLKTPRHTLKTPGLSQDLHKIQSRLPPKETDLQREVPMLDPY